MSEGGRRRRQPACGPERDISALCDITKGQHPQQTSFFQRKKERKPNKSMKGSGGWTISGGSSSHRCSQSELGVMQATAACSARSDGCVEVQSKRVRGPFRTFQDLQHGPGRTESLLPPAARRENPARPPRPHDSAESQSAASVHAELKPHQRTDTPANERKEKEKKREKQRDKSPPSKLNLLWFFFSFFFENHRERRRKAKKPRQK